MSLSDEARAIVLVADFGAADAGQKLNLIGAGFQITGLTLQGTTPPHSVVSIIEFPARYAGDECAVTLELRDNTTGTAVKVPTPDGGGLDAIRVSQVMTLNRPMVPNVSLPSEVPCRLQIALTLPAGLPLTAGHSFFWSLSLDGHHEPSWEAHFYVLGANPGPVFGGPSGPADIPTVRLT